MKTNTIISTNLGKDFYLRMKDMIFISLHFEDFAGAIILKRDEINSKNIKNFFSHFMKSRSGARPDCKLIGPQSLIRSALGFIRASALGNIKEVERTGQFEVVFIPRDGTLRVSKDASATSTTPVLHSEQPKVIARKELVKVLIVDDSKTIRNLLTRILNTAPGVQVVATAERPSEVEALINEHKPDVITLDIHMPEMTGVELLKRIQPKYKIPTIMVTSISMEEGPLVLEALEHGAFDYIQKPKMEEISEVAPILIEKVKEAANYQAAAASKFSSKTVGKFDTDSLVVIGSSTGGTNALKDILTKMPREIPPILIVQHIPAVFSKAFADRMNTLCPFIVKEAEDGELIEKNKVLVAPGGKQMSIERNGQGLRVKITDDPPLNRFKPSVDFLFNSVEPIVARRHTVGVILTGMGKDGAEGLLKLKKAGALTIAQNEESCVVFGMPREAIKIGAAHAIEDKNDIAAKVGEFSHPNAKVDKVAS